MSTTAIVYYSRTGTTRLVAEQLAQHLSADLAPIEDPRSRHGVLGFLRSMIEAVLKQEAAIIAPDVILHRYRTVVIATPVWASSVPSPVRTWLKRLGPALPEVALVCTYGGSGAEAVLKELARLTGKVPLAELALREADVRAGRCGQQLGDFATAIGLVSGAVLPGAMPA
jgi:hypothetical protein